MRELLSTGESSNLRVDNRTLLEIASSSGFGEIDDLLLQHKADPNTQDRYQSTPLISARQGQHEDIAMNLLRVGADHGTTHIQASVCENEEAVRVLLESGVDPNIQCELQLTALFRASFLAYERVARTLLEYGADPAIYSRSSVTALFCGTSMGYFAVVQLFLAAGLDINSQYFFFSNTMLFLAA